MEVLEEENAALRKELAQAKAKLEQYERSRVIPAGALFVVLFSVGLCWGTGLLGAPGSSLAGGYAHADIPNLRKLMSVPVDDGSAHGMICAHVSGSHLLWRTDVGVAEAAGVLNDTLNLDELSLADHGGPGLAAVNASAVTGRFPPPESHDVSTAA